MNIDLERLSRVSLITERGLEWERYGIRVYIDVQDDGRTLKVFVTESEAR